MYRVQLHGIAVAALVGIAGGANPVAAATFNVVNKIELGTCAPVASTATCDTTITRSSNAREIFDLVGRSEAGDLGVEASLTLDATSSISAQQGTFGSVNAVFTDTLTFGVESGILSLSLDVDGTQAANVPPVFGGTAAQSIISAKVNGTTVYERTLVDAQFDQEFSNGSLGTNFIELAFTNFSLDISASLFAVVGCSSVASGDICTASSLFLNSLRFTGGDVLNANGDIVTTTITSDSGFDYLTGLDPHGSSPDPGPGPSVIPLPATAWLLGLGVAGLVGLRRRRN